MIQIIGWKHSHGEYEGTTYDNINIFCVSDTSEDTELHGMNATTVKIKTVKAPKVLGTENYDSLIGKHVKLNYTLAGTKPVLDSLTLDKDFEK